MVPYNNVASDYLQTRYFDGDVVDANLAMSIPDTIAMFLIPALGMYVDKLGRRVNIILLGALAFILGHGCLALGRGRVMAIASLFVLGAGYSTLLCFWACVPTLVRHTRHSTAYGILTSICNLSVTAISLAVAPVVTADPSYRSAGLFFAGLALVALILGALLAALNVKRRLGLNGPAPMRPTFSLAVSVPMANPADSGRASPEPSHERFGDGELMVTVIPSPPPNGHQPLAGGPPDPRHHHHYLSDSFIDHMPFGLKYRQGSSSILHYSDLSTHRGGSQSSSHPLPQPDDGSTAASPLLRPRPA